MELRVNPPLTTRFLVKVNVVETVPPVVIELQEEETLTVGWFEPVKLASPSITLVAEFGTPAVQFPALFQLVFTVPFQLVWQKLLFAITVDIMKKMKNCIIFFIGRQ